MLSIKATSLSVHIFTIISAFMAFVYGGFDNLMKAVICCTIIDFLTGIGEAIYHSELSARECGKGIIRKFLMYCIIGMTCLLQRFTGITVPVREMIICFYIVQEALSVLENVGGIVTYPEKLRKAILQLSPEVKLDEQ